MSQMTISQLHIEKRELEADLQKMIQERLEVFHRRALVPVRSLDVSPVQVEMLGSFQITTLGVTVKVSLDTGL